MKQLLTLLVFSVGLMLAGARIAVADSLYVSFPVDTLNVCLNEPLNLSPTYGGGQAPYTFSWSTGDTGAQADLIPTQTFTTVYVRILDQAGGTFRDSIVLKGFPECVFPGDGNGDRLADNLDVLALGQSFNSVGALRPDAHLAFVGQPADRWFQNLNSGVDYVHSDTDGNGTVDADDLTAIDLNYSGPQTQPGLSGSNNGVPLYIDVLSTSFQPGDTIEAAIMLGTASQPVDSVYGLAFSVDYSSIFLDAENLWVDFSDSWLGNEGVDMIALDKNFANLGQVDIGISRTDQLQLSGYGQIAKIIVVIEDISGKNEGETTIEFSIDKVSAMFADGHILPIEASGLSVGILLSNGPSFEDLGINLYPNPSNGAFRIEWNDPSLQLENIQMFNLYGQEIALRTKAKGNSYSVKSQYTLSPGIYILRANSDGKTVSKRVLIY